MRVLLHICCAPCALMPVRELRAEGMDIMGLWFNPNIQPYTENRRRRETLESWAGERDLRLIVQDEYDPVKWLRRVVHREAQRCPLCYHERLTRAAQVAKKGGFDAFTSTLLYSVRQKHEIIRLMAEAVSAEKGIRFLYRDFRPFWKEGVELSHELELYRQAYCGCIYSESERYLGGPQKTSARR